MVEDELTAAGLADAQGAANGNEPAAPQRLMVTTEDSAAADTNNIASIT